uniref:NitT/TauT family transport system ATP-binding protein n=1 Tax=Candidatus Kentrum sp. LPFa TaxID=2126335 RepID=A0A450VXX1_9GAMM|nr:MAG: NitT/TauT family transport system ATP-binding protein [Candidatus Kentron sp. LPFa]
MSVDLNSIDFSFEGRGGRKKIPLFRSLTLRVPEGSVAAALVGPSGAGKSTLLRLIGGLLQPQKGSVQCLGQDARKCREQGDIGFVFQSPALLPWRTVEGNVRLPLELGGKTPSENRVEGMIAKVGLASRIHDYPHELSGGMQQRVALARALVARPKLLLLDEPFSQLDEILRFELLFKVQKYAADFQATVVLVTHDISEAVIASDTVYVLTGTPISHVDPISVDLSRPRAIESADSPAFHKLVSRLRSHLEEASKV